MSANRPAADTRASQALAPDDRLATSTGERFREAPPGSGEARGASGGVPGAPTLDFTVESAGVLDHAAVPTLEFALHIDAGGADVRSISLNVQVRIMAPQRTYDATAQERLRELFGDPSDWGRNLRSVFWLETSRVVPAFTGSTTVPLHVPCGYDFEISAAKYLNAVRDGEIPLELLFSGSVFYPGAGGALRTVRLPWDREARYRMPARLWHDLIERYYPNTAWLRVRRDVFDRLDAFRASHAPPTWDAAFESLLDGNES
jgi:hypothetical protein